MSRVEITETGEFGTVVRPVEFPSGTKYKITLDSGEIRHKTKQQLKGDIKHVEMFYRKLQ